MNGERQITTSNKRGTVKLLTYVTEEEDYRPKTRE